MSNAVLQSKSFSNHDIKQYLLSPRIHNMGRGLYIPYELPLSIQHHGHVRASRFLLSSVFLGSEVKT